MERSTIARDRKSRRTIENRMRIGDLRFRDVLASRLLMLPFSSAVSSLNLWFMMQEY